MVAIEAGENLGVATAPAAARVAAPSVLPRSRSRHVVFAVVSLALFMSSVDQTIVATGLGTLQRDLHAQVNWSSWTITVYALGQIVVLPVAGTISDLYGRKKVFLSAIVLFTVASLCCGMADNIYVLVVLRAVQALGGGAFMPSATGIVADLYGPDRDRAIGMFTSIFPIGGIVGPVLGGVFVTYWSWRGIFLVNVPLGVLLFVLALVLIPHSVPTASRRIDPVGIALFGGGLLSMMLAVSYLGEDTSSPARARFLVPLVAGVAALSCFVRHAQRAASPLVPLRLLTGRGFGAMNFINFVWGSTVFGFATLVPLYAEERYGIHVLAAGTLLTARAVIMVVISALAVLMLRRTGYRLPMIVGFAISAVGLALLAVRAHWFTPYVWLASAAAVLGLGVGMSVPASNNASLQLAPESTAAVAGLRGMFRQSGGITGLSIVTAVVARSANPGATLGHSFVVLAVLMACLIPLVYLVPDHRGGW